MAKVLDMMQFLDMNDTAIIKAAVQHLYLSFGSVLIGCLVAIPTGIWITGRDKIAGHVLRIIGTIQTIPSLALLGFALPLFGIGTLPAMIVLFLYSLLPILRNTYTGLTSINPAFIEAGNGMGMNSRQLLFMVKLPLAMPVIMDGIKISTVYILSWATLGALIGAGGLGDLIFTGIQTADANYILAGAVPVALLTAAAGWLLGKAEIALTPAGGK
jgi:osmoprotectant transport system permease protein